MLYLMVVISSLFGCLCLKYVLNNAFPFTSCIAKILADTDTCRKCCIRFWGILIRCFVNIFNIARKAHPVTNAHIRHLALPLQVGHSDSWIFTGHIMLSDWPLKKWISLHLEKTSFRFQAILMYCYCRIGFWGIQCDIGHTISVLMLPIFCR